MNVQQLITLNIEIEGLLRVYQQRGADEALAQARLKATQLCQLLEPPTTLESCGEAETELPQPEPQPAPQAEAPTTLESCGEAEAELPQPEPQPAPQAEAPTSLESCGEAEAELPQPAPAPTAEAPQAAPARPRMPIRNFFTINDKYLFRREVFDGDEQAFEDTLDLFAAMNSFDEAKEYIYDDLMLDPQNQDVKSFMEIIETYFK